MYPRWEMRPSRGTKKTCPSRGTRLWQDRENTGSERLIGDAAKDLVAQNPEKTIPDARRLIGRKFADPEEQSDIKPWPIQNDGRTGR